MGAAQGEPIGRTRTGRHDERHTGRPGLPGPPSHNSEPRLDQGANRGPRPNHPSSLYGVRHQRPTRRWCPCRVPRPRLHRRPTGPDPLAPRQSPTAAVLPDGWEIVARFWDIESGRTAWNSAAAARPRTHGHRPPPRRRAHSTCSPRPRPGPPLRRGHLRVDRPGRSAYLHRHRIEYQLEQAGVRLYAADEPIDPRGKRSTGLLTRRVKQGVAEWYVTDMLERSWDGFIAHTGQGWNIGKPPYG